jgi:YidC/Oxa1 family membrane protein insertase
MDRKTIIILVCCVAGMLLLNRLVDKIYPPIPIPPSATNSPSATTVSNATGSVTGEVASGAVAIPNVPLPTFSTNIDEQLLVVTNQDARLIFSSLGGGLKEMELFHHRADVSRHARKRSLTNGFASLNEHGAVPVLTVSGGDSLQGDGVFALSRTEVGVRAEKLLANGLRIVKEFRPSTNYLLFTSVRLENASNVPIALPPQEIAVGTATPLGPQDDGMNVGLMWHNGSRSTTISDAWFANRTLGCFPGTPRAVYREGQSNVVWAAAQNQFFGMVAMPAAPAQEVIARQVKLPAFSTDLLPAGAALPPEPKGYAVSLGYPALVLAPGQSVERPITVFAGPKEYRTLSRIADRFKNGVDDVMGFNMFPFYSIGAFFGKALLLAMNFVNGSFGLGYGLTIIVITVVIKLLFWPLTAASTRSMKRMAQFQPQMAAIREKYKDDPAKMNKKTMEFMRENKVNPLGGCLPMLLQMPVFFGFFSMIRSAIELRGASFLWVADLSKPDTLFYLPGIGFPFNPLPLLMGLTMLWQARLTPVSPTMDPVQQKMMKYMPLMFMVFLYNFSAGLTLYWTVQNLLTILQTKLTRSNEPQKPGGPAVASALTPQSKKKK